MKTRLLKSLFVRSKLVKPERGPWRLVFDTDAIRDQDDFDAALKWGQIVFATADLGIDQTEEGALVLVMGDPSARKGLSEEAARVTELWRRAKRCGVELILKGNALCWKASPGVVDEHFASELRRHKEPLKLLLKVHERAEVPA